MRLGLRGKLQLFVDGQRLATHDNTSNTKPFRDEHVSQHTFEAGVHRVVIALSQSGSKAPGFWLRFVATTPKGQPASLHWALPHEPACSLAELTTINTSFNALETGFNIRTHYQLKGLYPALASGLKHQLLLGREKAKGRTAVTLGLPELLRGHDQDRRWHPKKAGTTTMRLASDRQRKKIRIPYWGPLHREIVKLHATSSQLPSTIPRDSRDSFLWASAQLVKALEKPLYDRRWLKQRLRRLQGLQSQLAKGQDPYASASGVVHRAYRSGIDNELQKYVLYIPHSYAKRSKHRFPLMVAFHGLRHEPALALRIAFGLGPGQNEDHRIASRHLPPLPDLGTIVLAPYGYGASGPRQLGEADVLATIKRTLAHYRVDPRRISITGYSLGGTVAATVPLHYPSLFSAAAPFCGYPNLLTYRSIAKKPTYPWEKVMLQKRYIGNYIANGRHIPLHLVHGGRDGPQRSALLAKAYRKRGYRHIFDLQADLGHNVWDYGYENGRMLAWLRARRQPKRPLRLSLHTGELRYNKNRWLQLHEMPPTELARIDANYQPQKSLLVVNSKHATVFSIDGNALALGPDVRVRWNEREHALPEPGKRLYFIHRKGGDAIVTHNYQTPRGNKRPTLAGPIDDVLRHRTLIVWGSLDPAQTATNRLVAEHFQRFDSWSGARFPLRRDVDLGAEERKNCSLILIGNDKSNAVTRDAISQLPVRFSAEALVFRKKRYAGTDVGVSFIYPSPFSASEYVVLHAGVGAAGTRASRHIARLSPDFLVYNTAIQSARGQELLFPRTVLDGGFFDNGWR